MKIMMNLEDQSYPTVTRLNEKINNLKNEMYELAQEFGFCHELTVAKSQELDNLLNEWITLQSKTILTEVHKIFHQ